MVFSIGPVIYSSFGLYLGPITREFGWSRGDFSFIFLVFGLLFAITSPLVGRAIDRWGSRLVLTVGVALFGLANAVPALANGSLIQFYLLFSLMCLTAAPSSAVGYAKVISSAFDKRRGLVIALALGCGAGTGSAILPHLSRWMIDTVGWREARLATAAMILVIVVPTIALLLAAPRKARVAGAAERGPDVQGGVSTGSALKSRPFWLILTMMFMGLLTFGAMQVHTVQLLQDRGVDRVTATSVQSIYAVFTFFGQIAGGWALDRVRSPRIGAVFFASGVIGLAVIHYSSTMTVVSAGAAMLGLCFGAETILAAYYVSRYFGMKSYSEVYGILYAGAAVGSGLGPLFMGTVFDRFGSYNAAMTTMEIGLVACAACILALPPYLVTPATGARGAGPREPAGSS